MERDKLNKTISKRPSGVFYIDGNKSYYFEQTLSAPILLNIPVDTISNFELINKKKLTDLIQNFIKNNKLAPKNIVILLSTQVTFDNEFPHGSVEMQKNIQEFLELVPFEEIIERKVITSGRTKVIATNKEIVEALKASFKNAGFLVSGVYPLSLSMEVVPALKSNLDLSLFVNKLSDLKGFNLAPIVEAAYNKTPTPEFEKPDRTRLYALGVVFLFLIVILIFVVYTNIVAPKNETVKILPTPTPAMSIPTQPVQPARSQEELNAENNDEATSSAVLESSPSATTGSF